MKKLSTCFILGIVVLLGVTGCAEDDVDYGSVYNNTIWKSTGGWTLQIVNGKCEIYHNGSLSSRETCEFEENANDTGISKITFCSSSSGCRSENLTKSNLTKNNTIIDIGSSDPYYYQGKISSD